jgi:Domain of unknown function (DUF5666)
VARDAQRGMVVTAGRGGAVAALRVKRAAAFKPGLRVRVKATPMGDGTYNVRRVKRRGRAGAATARLTLVGRADRALVAMAGGTTFGLRSSAAVPAPGALVVAKLRLAGGKATVTKLRQVGQASTLTLRGRFAGFDGGVLRLEGGIAVTVPAGVQPALELGAEVELLVDAAFSLIAIDGELEVYGVLTAIAPTSLTVGTVTCAVPEDLDVSDLVVGDSVLVYCALVDGVLTAEDLELDDEGLVDDPFDEEEGEDDLP